MANTDAASNDLDDLLSYEAINDPFTYYSKLRAVHPVYWNARWNGWIVTGYDAVIAGYRDSKRLSSDRFSGPFGAELRGSRTSHQQLLDFLSRFFVWKDPPFHTQMRMLVNKAFAPKSVEALRPRVRSLVKSLAEPLADGERVDFTTQFAFPLPVLVIAEFLGVPSEARFEVRKWSEDLGAVIFSGGNVEDRLARGEAAMRNLVDFLRPIVHQRMRNPKEDLISRLTQTEENGVRLSEEDVVANVVLMVFAGHETTMNLLVNGIIAFDRFPDQWQRLRNDPEVAKFATEEILRYDGAIKGLGRWAREPLELQGQKIREGDRVLLVQHAANRDPQGFENPDDFDIGRSPNRHAAFGQGIHTCLGASLARLEVKEALNELARCFSRINVVNEQLQYNATVVSRSLSHPLEVKCHT